jgi:hypothetical protein
MRITDAGKPPKVARWVALAFVSFALASGCGTWGSDVIGASHPRGSGDHQVWVVELLHSASDRAEEARQIEEFMRVELPVAMQRGATLLVYTAGADGLTRPEVLSRVDFDTSDADGDNPVIRSELQAQRRDQLTHQVAAGTQRVPFSQATDVFGGIAAAKNFFDQYPAQAQKTFIAIGDELATRPTGCVLSARDMSTPDARAGLLRVCSPVVPDLSGVHVQLIGAGYSVDDEIEPAVARGLELMLREYFAAAHAIVTLYAPVLVASETALGPR